MTQATKRRGESIDRLLERFQTVCKKSGLTRDMRKHEEYIGKSEKRKLKAISARKKATRGTK